MSTCRMSLPSILQLDNDRFTIIFSNGQCSMNDPLLKVDGSRFKGIHTLDGTGEESFMVATAAHAAASAHSTHFACV